jgi:hypothetical protein
VDSSAGGATSSATADEGSSPSQDRSVDFLQKHTQLVVSQPRLLQQVLLAKMEYSQVRPDYCHGQSTEDAGNVDHSTLGGRLLLRPYGYRLLCDGGWRSALLHSLSHHLFNSGGYRLRAPLWSRGWRSSCAKSSSTVGDGLRLPVGSPTVSHTPSSPSSTGSVGGTSCIQGRLLVSKGYSHDRVLDYSGQGISPPQVWSPRP